MFGTAKSMSLLASALLTLLEDFLDGLLGISNRVPPAAESLGVQHQRRRDLALEKVSVDAVIMAIVNSREHFVLMKLIKMSVGLV